MANYYDVTVTNSYFYVAVTCGWLN